MGEASPTDRLLDGVEAVTFDLDGTLAEVARRRLRMWPALLAHPRVMGAYGSAFASLRGRRVPDAQSAVAAEVAARTGVPEARVATILAAEIDGRWTRLFRGAPVPAPVAGLLRAIDERGLPRAVVSDYPALDKLDGLGLGGFAVAIDCRALGALKPLPDGLWAAAAQLGSAPARTLHVGDRWDTDGEAAARAGFRFIHVEDLPSARR